MSLAAEFFRRGLRTLGGAIVSTLVWMLWLALVGLACVQLYIASVQEVEVPASVLQALEQRLELSGVRAKFGRTMLDPSGRLLMQDVSFVLTSFNEPVFKAESVFVRLDPWALLTRHIEPRELRISGASLLVAPMLSETGKSEELVNHVDATLRPGGPGEYILDSLTARVSTLKVNARGTVFFASEEKSEIPSAEAIARRYSALCKQLMATVRKLEKVEDPSVTILLEPSASRGAVAGVELSASRVELDTPVALEIKQLRLATRVPLLGETPVMASFDVAAGELQLPHGARIRGARVQMRGSFKPALFSLEPSELEITAHNAEAEGVNVSSFWARLAPGPLPKLDAAVLGRVMDAPLSVEGTADFSAKTARVRFEGSVGPGWLDLVSKQLGRDIKRWFDFTEPIVVSNGEAIFEPGWKLARLDLRFRSGLIDAYSVKIDDSYGQIQFTPGRLFAPVAYARIGKNFALGTYEQNLATKDFRFLLDGQLAPLDISGWFTAWWPNFFNDFEFRAGPPRANVDVIGRWRDGNQSAVFVYADIDQPTMRGVAFDHARLRIFVRPGFYDGLEVLVTSGKRSASGTFTYTLEAPHLGWKDFTFNGASTLDLAIATKLIGPTSAEYLDPFQFEQPPDVKASGRFEHVEGGSPRKDVRITAKSDGNFRFYDFPLEHIEFRATLHDDEIAVDEVRAGFAGGQTNGHAKIWGRDKARRLSFEYALKDASLGRAIALVQEFAAKRQNQPPPTAGKLIQEKNNVRVDLAANGEGAYNDLYSYHGKGVAEFKGPGLGEIRLLGGLSETLRFTALRFTAANAGFRIEGTKLVFPEISITGDNSAIQAHGDYLLDRKQLDFNAKLYPFQESGFILKKILDVALSPLSNVFEVKLTGTLDKPSWGLVLGPSNFLRNLTQPEAGETPSKPAETPASGEAPAAP